MPVFEYLCGKCKSEFELLVRGSEEIRCPACGSNRLKKLVSSFSFSCGDAMGSSSGCNGCTSHNCSSCSH